MNSQEYWNSRAMNRLTSAERKANQHIDKINKIYLKANLNIQQQIANIYKNYSKETGIDVDTLKELLSKKETDAFWKTMEGKGLKQYVKSNYKSRITRLEQIQAQLYAQAKGVYNEELRESTELYKDIINDSYYRTIYDTAIGTGYDFSFNKIDERTFETILNEKWLGSNYSQRIWKNTDIVADKISEVIGGSLISGQPMQYAINELINIFEVGRYYAERLVRTETNHFNSEAEALAYEELNVKKYVFVATLDSKTSEICQEHDHKVYELDKRQPGENYPPLHPNCRSTVRAYLGEEEERMLKRRAVNPITGKAEIVDNISYKDWKKKYVTNNEKDAIISQNIPNDVKEFYKYSKEKNILKGLTEFGEDSNGVIRGQRLNAILGYDKKPTIVDKSEFEKLASDSKFGKLYRGVSADSKETAEKYVKEFKNGKLYAGKGVYGNGTYVAYGEKGYSMVKAHYTNENGKIMTMLLQNDAKTIKYSELFKMRQKELSTLTDNDLPKDFKMAILMNDGYYASIKGYDAIVTDNLMDSQPYIVILNRGKVIMSENEL